MGNRGYEDRFRGGRQTRGRRGRREEQFGGERYRDEMSRDERRFRGDEDRVGEERWAEGRSGEGRGWDRDMPSRDWRGMEDRGHGMERGGYGMERGGYGMERGGYGMERGMGGGHGMERGSGMDYGYGMERGGYGMSGRQGRMAGYGGSSTGVGYGPAGDYYGSYYGAGHHGGPGEGQFEGRFRDESGWQGEHEDDPYYMAQQSGRGQQWRSGPDWPRQQGEDLEFERGVARERASGMSRWSRGRTGASMRGRGPQNYQRSDERIREDVCDRLTEDHDIDASDIHIRVEGGEVTLEGTVEERRLKWLAEEIASHCSGVKDVTNRLRVERGMQGRAGVAAGQEEQATARNGNGGRTGQRQTVPQTAPRAER